MEIVDENKTDILYRIEEFLKIIVNTSFEQLVEIAQNNNKNIKNHLGSDNVENLQTGIGGFLLFALDFYKYSKDNACLKKVESLSKELLSYCKNNATNNYSLYTGRAGFIYFLIELYTVNQDETLLHECKNLIIAAEQDYLESNYTSDYLYNGRAGTLLVLIALYSLSPSENVLRLINKFIAAILQNASFAENGISWKATDEINLKNSCGFALGSSGIEYVLKKMNAQFYNDSLDYIIKNIDKYKRLCWDQQKQTWLNFEKDILNNTVLEQLKEQYKAHDPLLYKPTVEINWSQGNTGILLSEEASKCIIFELHKNDLANIQSNIYEGLSGIGLALLESNTIENKDEYLKTIKGEIIKRELPITLNGGLLFGSLGAQYFLLKVIAKDSYSANIVDPFKINTAPKKAVLDLNLRDVKKVLLSKTFSKTMPLLENIFSQELNDFFDNPDSDVQDSEFIKFEEFIGNKLIKVETPVNNVIRDAYSFDKNRAVFFNKQEQTHLQVYLDQLEHCDAVIKALNNTDEWILNQKLKISEIVKIVHSKWDWEEKDNSQLVENFYKKPASNEFLFLLTQENKVLEYSLRTDGLILHRFDYPKKIIDALQEIKGYCQTQPPEMLKELSQNSGSRDVQDFIGRLDFLVLHKVKQLLYQGVLEIV
ncbi:MAG: lanthionine synthetase LanC family protein [Flavobacterium sp.]